MKINLLVLLGVLILAGLFTFYTDSAIMLPPEPQEKAEARNGQPVPDFSFTTLDGQAHEMAAFKGKVVLINFWASWCAPCIAEFPRLYKIAEEMGDNLVLIAISADESRENIDRFLSKTGTPPQNVLISWDKDKAISQDLFQTVRLPETIIVSPDGFMRDKIVGGEWDGEELHERLLEMLD